jgi:DNA-binding transcriptional MerR regulator
MTAATAHKRETWLDRMQELQPGSEEPRIIFSRDRFLQELARRGMSVDEATLRFWEQNDVLPRPIRKWDPEAKARRAYYPTWLLPLVLVLRELQKDGLTLKEIKPRLERIATLAMVHAIASEERAKFIEGAIAETDDPQTIAALSKNQLSEATDWIDSDEWIQVAMLAFFDPVRQEIGAHVRRYNRLLDQNKIRSARVVYYGENNEQISSFPVAFTFPNESHAGDDGIDSV